MSRRIKSEDKHFNAIFGADFHWRLTNPICRKDNYIDALEKKAEFICDLTEKHECPFLFAGDWFDEPKPVPEVIQRSFNYLPLTMWGIPGQHDLPQHNIDLFDKSGIALMNLMEGIVIHRTSFGDCERFDLKDRKIGLLHRFCYQLNQPWPGCEGDNYPKLIEEFSDLDLLIIGDNHKPWTIERKGTRIVNCGSIARKTSDQKEYKPRVYGWNAETNEITTIYLPIEPDVISDEHIIQEKEINEEMMSFVEGLETDIDSMGLNLEQNIKTCMKDESDRIQDCVWEIVGKAKGE